LIGGNPVNLIVGWCGRFLFFVVPRQFSQDSGEWPENQILIPDWTYFHCPGATLLNEGGSDIFPTTKPSLISSGREQRKWTLWKQFVVVLFEACSKNGVGVIKKFCSASWTGGVRGPGARCTGAGEGESPPADEEKSMSTRGKSGTAPAEAAGAVGVSFTNLSLCPPHESCSGARAERAAEAEIAGVEGGEVEAERCESLLFLIATHYPVLKLSSLCSALPSLSIHQRGLPPTVQPTPTILIKNPAAGASTTGASTDQLKYAAAPTSPSHSIAPKGSGQRPVVGTTEGAMEPALASGKLINEYLSFSYETAFKVRARERKVRCPMMEKRSLRLLLALHQLLTDQTDFTVIGVLGKQGVGKSMVMAELSGLFLPEVPCWCCRAAIYRGDTS